jgi:hypothetical protein
MSPCCSVGHPRCCNHTQRAQAGVQPASSAAGVSARGRSQNTLLRRARSGIRAGEPPTHGSGSAGHPVPRADRDHRRARQAMPATRRVAVQVPHGGDSAAHAPQIRTRCPNRGMTGLELSYFAFFCFFEARFSFRFFCGRFFSDFPPLSLLATAPPGVGSLHHASSAVTCQVCCPSRRIGSDDVS